MWGRYPHDAPSVADTVPFFCHMHFLHDNAHEHLGVFSAPSFTVLPKSFELSLASPSSHFRFCCGSSHSSSFAPGQPRLSGTMATPNAIIEALKDYTTCDVSDALCKLDFPNGGFLAGLTMWSPQRQDGPTKIVGPAYTVQYSLKDDPAPKHPTHYIDSIPEGAVVFVSCPPKIPNACYGGLMSARAKASKAVGSVIDGRFRDLQEQRDLNYPVFARDVGTAPPQQLLKVTGVNVPVKLQAEEQDITIHPGDYLIGDLNGVVVLPKQLAEQALPLMAKQVTADSKMAVEIGKGMSFTEASKKFRS